MDGSEIAEDERRKIRGRNNKRDIYTLGLRRGIGSFEIFRIGGEQLVQRGGVRGRQRDRERTWVPGSAAARTYGRSDGRRRYGLYLGRMTSWRQGVGVNDERARGSGWTWIAGDAGGDVMDGVK